ncbi:MAG: alpha-amylase family glycosyl hydrolase, partial [Pseudomonadota bacterium]
DKRMHMCYSFDFLAPNPVTGIRTAKILQDFAQIAAESWSCWAFSNHDVMRHASRWNLSEAEIRLHLALLMTLRGSVCLYQGEELGLTEAYVSYEELQDPYGKQFWPKFKGRDGCRTPMPWSSDGPNGGFSDAKPWLPVAMEHLARSVMVQEADEDSTLNFYRTLIAFRRMRKVLAKGTLTLLDATDDVLTFTRNMEGEAAIFCAFNLSATTQIVHLPSDAWAEIEGLGFTAERQDGVITLPPHQAFFAEN